MKPKLQTLLSALCLAVVAASALQPAALAQSSFEKIADDTFKFIKAGTFAKPSVSKKATRLALGHVRVHYKFITTEMEMSKGTSARITAYLDSDVTEKDLQQLTDEFYQTLTKKLAALGVEGVEWEKILATEYYKKRQADDARNKRVDGDVKSGQGWSSVTAKGGAVLLTFKPDSGAMEIVAYGQQKEIRKFCEEVGAPLVTLDAVVDFAAIQVGVSSGESTKYVLGGVKTKSFQKANFSVTPALMVNRSLAAFWDEKTKFDGYNNQMAVITNMNFSDKPYEDSGKAALNVNRFFGTTFAATPVVIATRRQQYLAAARDALNLYAELFVEKLRQIRSKDKDKD
jgi:hypothetical protein